MYEIVRDFWRSPLLKRFLMKRIHLCLLSCWLLSHLGFTPLAWGQFDDKSADRDALPKVPVEFEVTLFASEPLVRQPCSMAFDERGRLFVGMGPQYRSPKPDTPGDSVVLFLDTNGDGKADTTKVFATGFNTIQGLAWHGRDLWIANAPDLTVVRDVDGDDEADDYTKVYTDLGNLEHGLHGLTWAPDGKLYMSKGNSKGLNQPGRYAPKAFRDLWGVTAPADVPDFPQPIKSNKADYRRAYHDPDDDWGLDGGVLRCDDGGKNLEIVARGFRNPWDIAIDGGFNWLGTDNDQVGGDRVIMPFYGAHFGWNHPWSSHWGTESHAPTAPVSGPLFEGSGTGIVFGNSPQFPEQYRGAFFINDWLQKTTFIWRPQWDGALLRPAGGNWTPFIVGGKSLFRPTDLEFGPDGALWVLGWSSGYGAEWKDGELTNEGRIFRIAWKDAPPTVNLKTERRLDRFSIDELIDDFDSPLPVRRINAQDEMVRRASDDEDAELVPALLQRLQSGGLTENQETWTVWALGRMPVAESLDEFLLSTLAPGSQASTNLQVQAVRIFAHRVKSQYDGLPSPSKQGIDGLEVRRTGTAPLRVALRHSQPRVRFAAVQAMHEIGPKVLNSTLLPEFLEQLHRESDTVIFYAGWQALRALQSTTELRGLLSDRRAPVRRAALLAMLETHAASQADVQALVQQETDPEVRQVAELWLTKSKVGSTPLIRGPSLQVASAPMIAAASGVVATSSSGVSLVQNPKARSGAKYKIATGGFAVGTLAYVDRPYRLSNVPAELAGADLIQTANNDDNSRGDQWLTADAIVPVRVWVGIDARQKSVPNWVQKNFQREPLIAAIDEGATFAFYQRTFDAGPIQLGGNTDDGRDGGKGNYIVAVQPLPLEKQPTKATVEASLARLDRGDRIRGKFLFQHAQGAGCAKCHSLDQTPHGFGPSLTGIGLRANVRHIVQSIVEPSAVITEGFKQLNVITDEGNVFSGVLLEESGLTLALGQSDGVRVDIPKSSIDQRKTSPVSAMPEMAEYLTPQQVADLTTYLLTLETPPAGAAADTITDTSTWRPPASGFGVDQQKDRLHIWLDGHRIVDFVFRDDKILRPYFANARLVDGPQVTRNQPPVHDVDALDHDTMHPGIWLGLGDISGHDFWRNKAAMEHVRFVSKPQLADGRLVFATESRLKTSSGEPLCLMTNDFNLVQRPSGWLLVWSATFHADQGSIVFGDQEEMGFAARVATPFTEKNGGVIRSSTGKQTAAETWGQPAMWCDYSGTGENSGGIMLMASPDNFRQSWWHNRDYGVFVANPFGREAMQQGARSAITVAEGETLRIKFGAFIHDHREFDQSAEFALFNTTETALP